MQKEFITTEAAQTRNLGKETAADIRSGGVICLSGELGAGKTTFTQGLLEGLGLEGPFTSPTFLIMKEYTRGNPKSKGQMSNQAQEKNAKIQKVYHIDAYRVGADDVLALGWEEMVADKNNIIIIEWAERVRELIPEEALWIEFEWMGEAERKIVFKSKG